LGIEVLPIAMAAIRVETVHQEMYLLLA